jgi:hypothetical protein
VVAIPASVTLKLCDPIRSIALRCARALAAPVRVPETAMHKQDHSSAGEHNIGASRKVPSMQPKPIAGAMENTSYTTLGLRVPIANFRHERSSLMDSEALHGSGKPLISGTTYYTKSPVRIANVKHR